MNNKPHKIMGISLLVIMIAHIATDISQGAFPTLVPVIQSKYNLTYGQVGGMVLLMNLTSSICQPLFGVIVDKRSRPWFIPVGVLLSGVAMGLVMLAPTYTFLLFLLALSGIGGAIFHPQGMKTANRISSEKKKGSRMGIFSVGGNFGFAVGALLAGFILSWQNKFAPTLIAIPAILLTPFFIYSYPSIKLASQVGEKKSQKVKKEPLPYMFLSLITLFLFFRSTLFTGLNTYTPLYHARYFNTNTLFTGYYIGLFAAAGVIGTYLGGYFSDKIGRKTIVTTSMLISLPLVFLTPYARGGWALLLATVTGGILISSFSPILVMAQEMMPNNMGFAGGIVTGLGIGLGGVGAKILGRIADIIGLPVMLHGLGFLAVAAILCSLLLPGKLFVKGTRKPVEMVQATQS